MFWLILLAIPHHHHRHWRRHGRFYHPLYWLTGLAFLELAIWIAALEIAGELLAIWWLLWWASRGLAAAGQAMWEATQPVSAGGPDWRGAVDGARPPWPKRQAVSRLAATFGMSVIGPPHCWHVRSIMSDLSNQVRRASRGCYSTLGGLSTSHSTWGNVIPSTSRAIPQFSGCDHSRGRSHRVQIAYPGSGAFTTRSWPRCLGGVIPHPSRHCRCSPPALCRTTRFASLSCVWSSRLAARAVVAGAGGRCARRGVPGWGVVPISGGYFIAWGSSLSAGSSLSLLPSCPCGVHACSCWWQAYCDV